MRRAKIIATLGPSSSSIEVIQELIRAGINIARINMSHGTYEIHKQTIQNIRLASERSHREIGILIDLQGPKIRVDKLDVPLELKKGEVWVIGHSDFQDQYPQYKGRFIPTTYKDLILDCQEGVRILFDDGLLEGVTLAREKDVYKFTVTSGGILKTNKGINLPTCHISAPSFTEKDKKDLMFAVRYEIDYIALSFVKKKEDIQHVKDLLKSLQLDIPIISKIESSQSVDNIEEILEISNAIMIARGDMGVEIGNHLVPSIQKKIIQLCNTKGIPVITATQILESMRMNPSPTRAEASDVANAIWDGTDALMLSAESASGKYPVLSVEVMVRIIKEAEKTPKERPLLRHLNLTGVNSSLMVASSMIAEKINAKKIIAITETGYSCLKMAMFRPTTTVYGVTSSLKTIRKICLYWGIEPFYMETQEREDIIKRVTKKLNLQNDDKLVLTQGRARNTSRGYSNSVTIEIIKDQ